MSKQKSRAVRLSEALAKIEEGKSEIEGLREEIDSWKSGMEGTNLENTQKYSDLEECCDSLESGIDSIDSTISDLESVEFPGMF